MEVVVGGFEEVVNAKETEGFVLGQELGLLRNTIKGNEWGYEFVDQSVKRVNGG